MRCSPTPRRTSLIRTSTQGTRRRLRRGRALAVRMACGERWVRSTAGRRMVSTNVACDVCWMGVRLGALSLLLLACVLGCSGGSGNRRPTRPVTVSVVYKGAPVADATVTFISEEGEPEAAYGKTDAQGVAK